MTGDGNRIGDEINLKGISLKMMIELNERYGDVTHRLILVRSAKGDTPTRATLFKGQSGNKMLDGFNTERYSIVFTKTFKITARNMGTTGGQVMYTGGTQASGQYNIDTGSNAVVSRATRIVKVWIPGAKLGRGGKLQYEDASSNQVMYEPLYFLKVDVLLLGVHPSSVCEACRFLNFSF
jgi:hypothetical protein